ncbi:helicase-related protein [Myroides odoratimimus]|uniref:helicase-related protein n=1 Tax=Myroides odoratimimus TaxID=76832 RepID=UPI0025779008|nr:helicase-related protein [Myroides odoratimimus]MDM1465275.1 DEAD/DEAH box helicase family protein [Myroides odoratimimus]MDM1475279.1 DEAD/DEAH box helicase family protein [Myroides odoratimimus]
MDRQQRTLDVVIALNQFQNQELERYKFLQKVCEYFDFIKSEVLDDADYRFLIHLSSKAGVPHYYDILHKFNEDKILLKNEENVKLDVISALIFESTLYTNENSKLHLYQKEVLDFFNQKKLNRYFLSASTSFGKTHLVYEIINKMNYKNVILIFPSIALLSENLSRIKEGRINLANDYKIHTLSDSEINPEENNILIFTPERYLSYLDKNKELEVDFIFVDEVYKIDNSYIIDDESKENERDIAYRMSLFFGLTTNVNVDLFIAGPYIDVFEKTDEKYNPSFDLFLEDFKIEKVLLNEYEIVKVNKYSAEIKIQTNFDSLEVNLKGKGTKKAKIQELFDRILLQNENAIIYCNTKSNAEKVAREYERKEISTENFIDFINHLTTTFDERWIVIKALKKGIGVHHGVVPKYIQKEIIDLFNQAENDLNILSATTTITEGVNTTAKNMIVYKSSKGGGQHIKPLLKFDAKNIAGRAGRFMEHYVGRVITLDNEFLEVIEQEGKPIEHKNYDIETSKNEVEFEMTKAEFLDDRTKEKIQELRNLQKQFGIPDYIINQFKVISKRQKIDIYKDISQLTSTQISLVKKLISSLNSTTMSLDKDGFQIVLDVILPQVESEGLKHLITNSYTDKFNQKSYSILYIALNKYISNGFNGNYEYYLEKTISKKKIELENKLKKESEKSGEKLKRINISLNEDEISMCVDSAMRETAELIYNTFKYQLVKYLGVFNLMYKYYISKLESKILEESSGIDILLIKLEYNAFSEAAKIASDYGVPNKIVAYYDAKTTEQARNIQNSFDTYEKNIFEKVKKIIEK